ncbi:hypothetical protein GNF10_06680 [Nostoc sp. UCD121]|uniref:hypothetical protein n=1 Tax=unclassified Nostoc TaxID=2593658 RepID=UPI0016248948|nr:MULTISPECIES: hypothetical protein [unclassified Nostoc]MBC1220104.1 hypothetical protein [Nostoc sp. UCD120]MBC1275678.1 hypothetical protein [Nostoc sp. UCD121]MBC1298830.1 hypothetical protein [Nostoc sp. UCD122]
MNIVKLVLLAFSTLLVSIMLVVNPANASSLKSLDGTQIITVVSTQQIPEPTILNLIQTSNPISDGVGCNCANCVPSKFQSLQGQLPSVGF